MLHQAAWARGAAGAAAQKLDPLLGLDAAREARAAVMPGRDPVQPSRPAGHPTGQATA